MFKKYEKLFTVVCLLGFVFLMYTFSSACLPNVHPTLRPYVEEWIEDCKDHGIDYAEELSKIKSIRYSPLIKGYWGICFNPDSTLSEGRIITISSAIEPTDAALLRLVVYHELGHCAFDYDHIDNSGYDIMNSVLPNSEVLLYNYMFPLLKKNYFQRYERSRHRENQKNKARLDRDHYMAGPNDSISCGCIN
jgi:hypothetical protein